MIDWNLANTTCLLNHARNRLVVTWNEGNFRQQTYMSVLSSIDERMGRGVRFGVDNFYASWGEEIYGNVIFCCHHIRQDLINTFENISYSYKPRINTYFPELEANQYPTLSETEWIVTDRFYPIEQFPEELLNKVLLKHHPPDPFQATVSFEDHWEGLRTAGVDMPAAVRPGGRVAEVGRVERDREAAARNGFDDVVARFPGI